MYENDFNTLCVPHYPELVNFAMRLTNGNRAQALDVVHDSLERALRHWEKWSPSSSDEPSKLARAWLYRIVANTFVHTYKRAKNRFDITKKSASEIVESSSNCVVEYKGSNTSLPLFMVTPTEDTELSDEMQEALSRIHPEYRKVVELVYIHGMKQEEVAERLGVPFGTVRSRLERGRVALARILAPYVQQEYGILLKRRTERASRRRARKNATALQSAELPETDTDSVDSIVGEGDFSALALA